MDFLLPPVAGVSGRRINLLKLLDLGDKILAGSWKLDNAGLHSLGQNSEDVLRFNYVPPLEYDYRLEFTRTAGDKVVRMVCVTGNKEFLWLMGASSGEMSFLANQNPNPSVATCDFSLNNPHTCLIRMRQKRVEAVFDNGPATSLEVGLLRMDPNNRVVGRRFQASLGLSFRKSVVDVTAAELTEVTGEGTILK